MREWWEREGTLTYGGTTVRLRLAGPRAYRPISKAIWPETKRIAGAEPREQDPNSIIARWTMRDWSRGELRGVWEPGGFNKSSNVKPDREGTRLELGAFQEVTDHDGGASLTESVKFGHGQSLLWTADDASLHWWQVATDDWDQTGWATGLTTQTVVSITDMGDGTHILVSADDESIAKVSSGGDQGDVWTSGGGASYPCEIRYSQGTVYMLDGANLYSLDTSTSDTRTTLSEPGGRVDDYMNSSANLYRRMCVTDTGVAWLVPQDNGRTAIMEYNSKSQTDRQIGELPEGAALPYSMEFAYGFLFVGYREASLHGETGDARIYYQRGAQRGTSPVIRSPSSSTASQPVLIAGVIADDLIFFYDGAVWAYDLSAGAVFMLAAITPTTGAQDAATFGKDVFVSNATNAYRVDTALYSTDSATWDSGRFNFDLPTVKKALLRVTVVTDPLPANTQITLKVAADGGSFTAVTGTYDTDNDTSYTWTVSSSTSQVTGRDFELQLIPASTASGSTPQIREVSAEAVSAEKRRGVELDVDLSSGQVGKAASGPQLLSQLRAAAEYTGGIVSLKDVWGTAETASPTTSDVVVELAAGLAEDSFATVRCWDVGTV